MKNWMLSGLRNKSHCGRRASHSLSPSSLTSKKSFTQPPPSKSLTKPPTKSKSSVQDIPLPLPSPFKNTVVYASRIVKFSAREWKVYRISTELQKSKTYWNASITMKHLSLGWFFVGPSGSAKNFVRRTWKILQTTFAVMERLNPASRLPSLQGRSAAVQICWRYHGSRAARKLLRPRGQFCL